MIESLVLVKWTSLWLLAFVVILIVLRKYFVEPEHEEMPKKKGKKQPEECRPMSNGTKAIIFWLMVIPVIFSTLYISSMTIVENIQSVTKGPVHWHADYQVWACGEELDLKDPRFPSNKIGSPLLHEHNDHRIHVEGTISHLEEVSLSNYFTTIGGALTSDTLSYPTASGLQSYTNGQRCSDGSIGQINVYVNGKKVEDYENHIMYPDAYVPPGDCIIIEFSGTESVSTNKICESWEVKGWNYDSYEREDRDIGGRTWQ